MTADQAYELAKTKEIEYIEKEKSIIMNKIERAAKEGKYSILIEITYDETINMLLENGYVLNKYSCTIPDIYFVEWRKNNLNTKASPYNITTNCILILLFILIVVIGYGLLI